MVFRTIELSLCLVGHGNGGENERVEGRERNLEQLIKNGTISCVKKRKKENMALVNVFTEKNEKNGGLGSGLTKWRVGTSKQKRSGSGGRRPSIPRGESGVSF